MKLHNLKEEKPQLIAPNHQRVVEIKSVTWSKESHGLFDYENNFYEMKKFQVQTSVEMVWKENNILCIPKKIFKQQIDGPPALSFMKKAGPVDEYFVVPPKDDEDPSL